jgi:hypothetical protein
MAGSAPPIPNAVRHTLCMVHVLHPPCWSISAHLGGVSDAAHEARLHAVRSPWLQVLSYLRHARGQVTHIMLSTEWQEWHSHVCLLPLQNGA